MGPFGEKTPVINLLFIQSVKTYILFYNSKGNLKECIRFKEILSYILKKKFSVAKLYKIKVK